MKKIFAFLLIAAVTTGCSILQPTAAKFTVIDKKVWRVNDTVHFSGAVIIPLPSAFDTSLAKYDSLFNVIEWIIRNK